MLVHFVSKIASQKSAGDSFIFLTDHRIFDGPMYVLLGWVLWQSGRGGMGCRRKVIGTK